MVSFFFLFIFLFTVSFSLGVYFLSGGSLVVDFFLGWGSFLTDLGFSFLFDYVSLFFFSCVSLISSVVFLYSKFYMDSSFTPNSDNSRFFFLLFLFVVSMFFLVFSNSWVVVMLGWDGLGLVSFLLVIYYNNSSSLDSGLVTVFTNRLGDCFFILSFIFVMQSGWYSFDFLSFGFTFFFFVVFLGSFTKSAQYPFSSWLPAAMAAPTPVSSLVHSSTLVTAGVYLLIRFNFLLSGVWSYISFLSLLTMCLAGLCALYELDFKKVVAMSTLSQLGFMIFSVSLGYWALSFLHMVFHAFFKSSLFLSTGSLMHLFMGDQDSRYFGGLGSSFFSKTFFFMSCLSLSGFPFSLGFFSKDSLIALLMGNNFSLLSFLFFVSCCFTVAYSVRLVYMGFLGFPSFFLSVTFLEEFFFYSPLFFLYTSCIFFGNFFYFCFLPPFVLSFLDFFLGGAIITLGVLLFSFSSSNYILMIFTSSISFLSVLSTSFLSNFSIFANFKGEYTWSEIFGGKGVEGVVFKLGESLGRLYELNFLLLLVLVVPVLGVMSCF